MHQVKKLDFDIFCFLREVVNLKAKVITCELQYGVVAFKVWEQC
uniref:Uncharacterized protein n=1 Tax=Lepeophtheirus salmonis TaxID=72036 RepID=A0A0K2VKA3_LEPSM